MVTTRSGTTTTRNNNNNQNNKETTQPRVMIVEVMEDMLVEAQERAKFAERALAICENKCNMLEYELMFVRNEHVNEMLRFEKESKNRQFHYLFWLISCFLLEMLFMYYLLC